MNSIYKSIYKFSWWVDHFTKYACVALTVTMFFNVIAQVFCNYVLRNGLSWSEEFSRLLLVTMTFFGASLVTRRSLHIGLTAFLKLFPYRIQNIIKFIGFIIVLFFLYGLILWGVRLSIFGISQTSTYLNISYFWFYLGIPIGGVLIFIQTFYLAFREVMIFLNRESVFKEIEKEEIFTPSDY